LLCRNKNLLNELVHVEHHARRVFFFEHRADLRDHVVSASRVLNDALYRRLRLFDIETLSRSITDMERSGLIARVASQRRLLLQNHFGLRRVMN